MGEVYRASDTRLGRDVALKFPVESILRSPRMMGAFEREARAAASLNHPNICTVYGAGDQDGRPFIAMELLDGETLDTILNRRELSIDEVVTIALQVAAALDAAHARGVVHRDIKPGNIFVCPGNTVKVVDFGIAKCATEVEPVPIPAGGDSSAAPARSTIVGTPRYMAPEQLEGGNANIQSDIFSFGVMLYEMITRQRPFEGDAPEDLAEAIRSSPPRSIPDLRPGIPPKLAHLVHRCLQADPARRWQKTPELIAQLKAIEPDRRPRKWLWGAFGAAAAVVLVAGTWYWRSANAPPINSIAVLPFTNASHNADLDYLTDGITEGVINSLSSVPQLKVIARTTAFTFKGKEIDARTVGRELGVQAVLTGKISIESESLFIQADLVNVDDRSELWGESFRHSVGAVQNIHTDIAGEIADRLRLKLKREERQRVTKPYTENNEAFDLYLKAIDWPANVPRYPEGFFKRIELLQQATAKDPGFAWAYVQLARVYRTFSMGHIWPNPQALQKHKEVTAKALELDPDLGDAHVERAISLWWREWDWAGADREFQRARELDANSAHMEYSIFLAQIGRKQQALVEAQKAIEVDPRSRFARGNIASVHWLNREFAQALEATHGGSLPLPGSTYPLILEGASRYDEAIAQYQARLDNETAGVRGHLGRCYAMVGKLADARRILGELKGRVEKDGVGAYEVAFINAALGDKDEAFRWLDLAYKNHDSGIKFLKTDSNLDVLRSDPRFDELVRRVGLPK
jgi:serine/threonine-protein kinase